jgi:autotransporter adhesin
MLKKTIFLVLFGFILGGQTRVCADLTVNDDLIVSGGACVGYDCYNGENLDETTLRLKENNTRILLQDTSEDGSPGQDWWLIANDTSNGGANIFAVGDEEMPVDVTVHAFDDYVAPLPNNSQFYVDRTANIVGYKDAAGHTTCYSGIIYPGYETACPAEITETVNRPDLQDFAVDPGTNVFHITADAVLVGTEDAPRRLSNVADGLDARDVATVAQLNDVEATLAEVNALEEGASAEMTEMDNRLGAAETQIGTNRSDIDALQSVVSGYMVGSDAESAQATGIGSTALGSGASARTLDTAIGANATVTADGSVAVGADTRVDSQNSVAVGADSRVEAGAAGGVALGQNARVASGSGGAVAVGQDSVATQADTVSVGSDANRRRITNAAAGVADDDAVTVGQLQVFSVDADIARLLDRLDGVDERADDVGALTTAFSALVPNGRSRARTQVSLGLGHYSGSNAVAAGVFHYLSEAVVLNAGVSSTFHSNATALQTGLAWAW